MNLVNSLIIVAVVSLVIFIIKFSRQIHRIKRGRNYTGPGSVFVNWVLILAFIISIAGIGYEKFANHQASDTQTVAKAPSATKAVKDTDNNDDSQNLKLKFRDDVTMDSDGVVRLKITVSAGAKVVIKGANSGKKYAGFTAPSGSGTVTKVVVLDSTGPYKVVASRGGKKVTKNLVVRDNVNDDNTSASTDVSSSSSQRPASSSASSVSSSAQSSNSTAATTQTAPSNSSAATTVGQ